MQSNNTSGSSSVSISGENIVSIVSMGVSLCLSFITFLTTILACTYIVLKSKFRDKQNTDIEISTETAEGKAKIKISLLNNETYSVDAKKFNNKKEFKNKKLEKNSDDNASGSNRGDLDEVLSNNNKGDVIIATTRSEAINGALNTFLKAAQSHSLEKITNNKPNLDLSPIHVVASNGTNTPQIEDMHAVKIDIIGEGPE